MRKYRCNRILEDRKISRRLCAPFFFPLSYENGRGQRKVEQLSAPLLRFTGAPPKILFRTRMIRERIQRTDGCVIRIPKMLSSFVRKRYTLRSHENYSKTIPPARCESEETLVAVHRAGKRDAISIHSAQSSHSPHDCPYCIGVRASAYINKRAPSVYRGVSRGVKYISF